MHNKSIMIPLDYFSALVQQDNDIPLFEAALALAQDGTLDLGATQTEVDIFAAQLQECLPSDTSHIQKLQTLNHFFYRELGFTSNLNYYDDPRNNYLPDVIATRRGVPISLAIIYMELAQQIDLNVEGISFPGHFLMKLSIQSGEIIIDPADGSSLSREELEERLEYTINEHGYPGEISFSTYLQAATPRTILVRMLHHLKTIFMEHEQWEQVLEVQERLLLLLPDETTERRDRGLAYARLDDPEKAQADLNAYLSEHPMAPDAPELQTKLIRLRATLANAKKN